MRVQNFGERYTKEDGTRIFLLVFLILLITALHYSTNRIQSYHHIMFRQFYFLPVVLASFWYGLRGGLSCSIAVSILYIPHVIMNWQDFSPSDLDKCIEIVFYNLIAIILGIMKDRERMKEKEKQEIIRAMTGTIAHELNSPVQVILGNAQLLEEELKQNSDALEDINVIIKNIKTIQKVISKLSLIDDFILKDYAGENMILEIDRKPR